MGLGLRMGMDPPLGTAKGLDWIGLSQGLSQQRQKGEVLNRNSPFLVGAKINLAEI